MVATMVSLRTSAILLAGAASAAGLSAPHLDARTSYLSVCKQIASAVSNASEVFYPLSIGYTSDVAHWATSSSQSSACSVEPGTAEDVGVILQIVSNTSTPFAVKGGGHTANPGFSSTAGVHISMSRFGEVSYDASSSTAVIGAGLVWDDVYEVLEEQGVIVVGGRVTGVGVAGFTLGGGFSWLTNQHGLTIDTVQAFELVLPNGTVTTVTSSSNPDLFFGLKGGFNNFGIVTRFTLKTFAQGQVWGGIVLYTGDKMNAVAQASANFSASNTDPKAAIITELNTLIGLPGVTLSVFYDGPSQPAGIFDEFLAIEAFSTDLSTRSFSSLVQSAPSNATADLGQRGAFHTVSVSEFTPALVDVIVNETIFYGSDILNVIDSASFISYDIEPFLDTVFSFGSEDSSAWPPDRSKPLRPLNLYYAWSLPSSDDHFRSAIAQSAATIQAAAEAEGQDVSSAALYGNYAISSTAASRVYGDNLDRLSSIRAQYDPSGVMKLAGGWKF